MKNHYQTLRLPPNASQEDIKKAFRKLALQFHPDKNDTASSHALFLEIQESYIILSDPKKKKLYDEERYFSGLSSRKEPTQITAGWILKLAQELRKHTAYLHSYDLNHTALYDYTLLILSDTHLAYLEAENDPDTNSRLVEELLMAVNKINYAYYEKITTKLLTVNPVEVHIPELIRKSRKLKKDDHISDKWLPWIVTISVLLLCILMYLYGKRH